MRQVGRESLTVSTTAVALASLPSTAVFALIYCPDASIRWRADGTAPTASAGMYLGPGMYLDLTDTDGGGRPRFTFTLTNIQFIRAADSAADATLEVAYFA